MTEPCVGVLGRFFGHRFITFTLAESPPSPTPLLEYMRDRNDNDWWTSSELVDLITSLTTRTCGLACSRCGIGAIFRNGQNRKEEV